MGKVVCSLLITEFWLLCEMDWGHTICTIPVRSIRNISLSENVFIYRRCGFYDIYLGVCARRELESRHSGL